MSGEGGEEATDPDGHAVETFGENGRDGLGADGSADHDAGE